MYYFPPSPLTSSHSSHLLQLHDLKSFEINSRDGLYNDCGNPSRSTRRHFQSFLSQIQLEELSWQNLATEADVMALGAFMVNNESRLKKLRLEFHRTHNDSTLRFSKQTKKDHWLRSPKNQFCKFGSLKVLSLANLDFAYIQEQCQQQVATFNMSQLTHLTLDACQNAHVFLETMAVSSTEIRLRYLQLIIAESLWFYTLSRSKTSRVAQFLLSFQGLEELYVMTCPGRQCAFGECLPSIANHAQTLRRLVWHERKLVASELIGDTGNMGTKHADNWKYGSSYPDYATIARSNLEYLGISAHPSSIVSAPRLLWNILTYHSCVLTSM